MTKNTETEEIVETQAAAGVSLKEGVVLVGVGAAVGAAAALLLAPKKGSELRGDIADATKRGVDATVGKAADLSAQAADLVGTVREKATAAYDAAAGKLTAGTDAVAETAAVAAEIITETPEPAGRRKGSNIV